MLIWLTEEPKTLKTLNELYTENLTSKTPLLTDFTADWWNEYITNYDMYDAMFNRMFKSWIYFNQEFDDVVSEVLADFKSAVKAHLAINSKKYSELYRIQVIDDDTYSIINNYNLTETMAKKTSDNTDDTLGARTDTTDLTKGAEEYTVGNQKAPYDSETYYNDNKSTYNMGSRSDSNVFDKGQQINNQKKSGTEDYKLERAGNIGVKTITEMLKEHTEFWTNQEFYKYIFAQIANELLYIE